MMRIGVRFEMVDEILYDSTPPFVEQPTRYRRARSSKSTPGDEGRAMSQENVEVVKALYEVWNGPDGGENAIAFLSDDFEWVNPDFPVEPDAPSAR